MKKDINSQLKKAENLPLPDSLSEKSIRERLGDEKPLGKKRTAAAVVRRTVAAAAVLALAVTTLVIAKPWDGHVKVPAGEPSANVDVPGSDSYASLEKLFVTYYKANRLTLTQKLTNGFSDLKYATTNELMSDSFASGAAPGASAENGSGTVNGFENGSSESFGQTNEQVAGVNEADIIKNDGKYLYVVSNNYARIYDYYYKDSTVSYGSEGAPSGSTEDAGMAGVFIIDPKADGSMEIIGKISVNPGENYEGYFEISNIYVTGDTLIAIGCSCTAVSNTFAVFYDISDRTAPREITRFYQSGSEVSTRLTGGRLFIITNHYVDMTETETQMKETCIPMTGRSESAMARVPSQNICVMDNLTSPSYLVVTSLDITSPETEPASAAVLGGGDNIYCNTERLYVMSAQYDYSFMNVFTDYSTGTDIAYQADGAASSPVNTAAETVKTTTAASPSVTAATPAENEPTTVQGSTEATAESPVQTEIAPETVNEIAPETAYETAPETVNETETAATQETPSVEGTFTFGDGSKTTVYSFDIGDGGVKYLAKGTVEGTALNQFSADEYDGYFRIATTTSGSGSNRASLVTVLNDKLETVGRLTNLGTGETIQSVRFMGTRGYVVTFLQTDPLFVIDLSEPGSPVLLGELKLPGFSSYLHPVSSTLLIGIGQDGDDDGTNGGLKVSLFDVSDPTKPVEADKYVISSAEGYVYSAAYYDAKAICWDGDNAVFYFPSRTEKYYSYNDDEVMSENALTALKVDAAGKVFGTKTAYTLNGAADGFTRVTYIGNTVFGLSDSLVVSFAGDTAEKLGSLDYAAEQIGEYTAKQ